MFKPTKQMNQFGSRFHSNTLTRASISAKTTIRVDHNDEEALQLKTEANSIFR